MAKPIDRTYMSTPIKGMIYLAEYSLRRSRKLRWTAMAELVIWGADGKLVQGLDSAIDARKVPLQARRDAQVFMGV